MKRRILKDSLREKNPPTIFCYNYIKNKGHILEEKEEHLVKQVSKELGLTYKELADKIGYTESNLKNLVFKNLTTNNLKKSIELYLETLELKKEVEEAKQFRKVLKTFITKED